jgi:hypothetical protein
MPPCCCCCPQRAATAKQHHHRRHRRHCCHRHCRHCHRRQPPSASFSALRGRFSMPCRERYCCHRSKSHVGTCRALLVGKRTMCSCLRVMRSEEARRLRLLRRVSGAPGDGRLLADCDTVRSFPSCRRSLETDFESGAAGLSTFSDCGTSVVAVRPLLLPPETPTTNVSRAPPGGLPHFRFGKGVGGDGGIGGKGDVHWRQSRAKAICTATCRISI